MAADLNKEVVRGFITEVLIGGQFDRIDEFLAPSYVNRAFGVDLPVQSLFGAASTIAGMARSIECER